MFCFDDFRYAGRSGHFRYYGIPACAVGPYYIRRCSGVYDGELYHAGLYREFEEHRSDFQDVINECSRDYSEDHRSLQCCP